MYSQDLVLTMIGMIYDAVATPEGWTPFLGALAETINGHTVNLSYVDPSHDFVSFMSSANADPAFLQEYENHYSHLDPWLTEVTHRGMLQRGAIGLGESVVSPAALNKTEFYNDFGRRFQFTGGISAFFEVEESMAAISMCQFTFGQFRHQEVELVQAFLPHLSRAMQMHRRLEGAKLMATNVVAVLDKLPHGVLFVSAAGKVLFANRAADDVLRARDGLILDHGELRASTPPLTSALRASVNVALDTGRSIVVGGRTTISLPRASGRRPLSILATPLPTKRVAFLPNAAAAAIFVTDPERAPVSCSDSFAAQFHLTPSESHLVQCLVDGDSLERAAERLTIRLETVRKRVKLIFHKTDTHRQADLIRLVLTTSIPVIA
jgi:DNA-binding CsgD family transcriptional regulator